MSRPKKILLLDTGNEWGGGTNSMFELLKRIDRARFDITCCFYKDYRKGEQGRLLSEELADIAIPMIVLPTQKQPFWAKLAKELLRGLLAWSPRLKRSAVHSVEMRWRIKPRAASLAKVLRDGAYDLLYMNNQPSSNLEGYLAAGKLGLPVVQHCRIEPTLQPYEIAIVNRTATRLICVSQGVADVFKLLQVGQGKLRVVYNAIDSNAPLPAPNGNDRADGIFVVGTVGQLTARKAVGDLIQAVANLKAERYRIVCQILGEGPQREALLQLAQQLGVAEDVMFLGFQAQPLAWVQEMDVCVLCSSKEGLPRVVLEAMLSAKPVIGSDVTGTRELVVHERTGMLYPYGDVEALTLALSRLLSNSALREKMGQAGRKRVEEYFSIEAYVEGVSQVLAEAAA